MAKGSEVIRWLSKDPVGNLWAAAVLALWVLAFALWGAGVHA